MSKRLSFALPLLTPLLLGAIIWLYFTNHLHLFTMRDMVLYGVNDWYVFLILWMLNVPVYTSLLYSAVVGTMIIRHTYGIRGKDLGFTAPLRSWRTILVWCISIPALFAAEVAGAFAAAWMRNALNINTISRSTLLTTVAQLPLSRDFMIMLVCIFAPVCEEVLFRGFIHRHLANRLPAWLALVISSAIFATFHLDISNWWSYFLPGVVFGLLVQTSKSLWPPILLHSMLNTFFVLITLAS